MTPQPVTDQRVAHGPGKPDRILLFDIDGTLLVAGGAGRIAMDAAFRQLYALPDHVQPTAGIDFAGASDFYVVRSVAAAHDREYDAREHERFLDAYQPALRDSLAARDGQLLPGVRPLLDHLRDAPVLLGLGTGNFRATAFLKLAHFGIDGYFDACGAGGGFGDDGATRPEFLAAAIERMRPLATPDAEVVVIGDTVHDVAGGHAVGARVVAVATGFSEREALVQAGPDVLLDDCRDLEAVLEALLG